MGTNFDAGQHVGRTALDAIANLTEHHPDSRLLGVYICLIVEDEGVLRVVQTSNNGELPNS